MEQGNYSFTKEVSDTRMENVHSHWQNHNKAQTDIEMVADSDEKENLSTARFKTEKTHNS